MLAVPPAFLDQLHLQVGTVVGLAIDHDCLVVASQTTSALHARGAAGHFELSQPQLAAEREWVDAPLPWAVSYYEAGRHLHEPLRNA